MSAVPRSTMTCGDIEILCHPVAGEKANYFCVIGSLVIEKHSRFPFLPLFSGCIQGMIIPDWPNPIHSRLEPRVLYGQHGNLFL